MNLIYDPRAPSDSWAPHFFVHSSFSSSRVTPLPTRYESRLLESSRSRLAMGPDFPNHSVSDSLWVLASRVTLLSTYRIVGFLTPSTTRAFRLPTSRVAELPTPFFPTVMLSTFECLSPRLLQAPPESHGSHFWFHKYLFEASLWRYQVVLHNLCIQKFGIYLLSCLNGRQLIRFED